jgi:Transcriptional regulator, AbiEi antitoxin, Type IV TA system
VKTIDSVKIDWDFEQQAGEKLTSLLSTIPTIRIRATQQQKGLQYAQGFDWGADFILEIDNQNTDWQLIVEVKNTSHPSRLANSILKLLQIVQNNPKQNIYPVLIVPWLSDKLMNHCADVGIGCMDLEGNFRLVFGGVYAVSRGAPAPAPEQQRLRSLFSPKSSRVLRVLLRDPKQIWRIQSLSETAGVSLGHAHKVKAALEERGWLESLSGGIYLSQPKDLLETWSAVYTNQSPINRYYTLKHGKALAQALQPNDGQHWLYTSFSAADWLAPFVRQEVLYLVADESGMAHLQQTLKIELVETGFNLVLMADFEGDILQDRFEAASNIWTTSPVQTYLELMSSHDRGREAAAHLYQKYIEPTWKPA